MAGGYANLAADPYEELRRLLQDVARRVDELERPTGTQQAQALQQIRDIVDGIVSAPNITITGTMSANAYVVGAGGIAATSGISFLDGGIVSSDVKTRTLAVGYDAVYIDSSNRMGKAPSARRYKQDIESFKHDADALDNVDTRKFRLIEAVEILGEDAKVETGVIAEELDALGLGEYVTRDNDGTPHGVAYERLTIPLINVVQSLRAEMAEVRAALGL